jgi:hypothetical protein
VTTEISIWAGALATLGLYSILYRENRLYRATEHIFIGLGIGYGLVVIWTDTLWPKLWTPMLREGRWWFAALLIVGGLFYTVYSRKYSWMARWVTMGLLGLWAGQAFKAWANRYQPQIASSFKPIFLAHAPYVDLNNVIFVVALLSVMLYFFFSFEQKSKPVQAGAKLGRWTMMIAFGAIFGSTVMARMSLFIGRLVFLFREWIPLIPK